MATVVGFRHGMVENPKAVIYARLPGFPLAAAGLEHAERLGELLASARVTAVFASPLDRAMQTAKALAEPHGLEVVPDERLIEWSFWVRWAGTPWGDLPTRQPEVAAYESDPAGANPDDPLPQVGERVLRCLDGLVARHHGSTVAAVGHGSLFSQFTSRLKGERPTESYKNTIPFAGVAVVAHGDAWRLVSDFAASS